MTKRRSINVMMSDEEIEAYQEARRGRTHRELLLGAVGIDANPKPLGRPRFKYGKDAKLRSMRCRNCSFTFKTDAPLHGSICPRCRYNSIESPDPEWRTLTCNHCGNVYETARLGFGSSFCWRCKVLVKEVPPFEWPKVKETGPRQDTLTEEEAQGSVEMTESKRAQMHFHFSEVEWASLSEEEKEDYIRRLPPKKVKAGGEELSDRDSLEAEHARWAQDKHRFFADVMEKKTRRMQKGNEQYRQDREV